MHPNSPTSSHISNRVSIGVWLFLITFAVRLFVLIRFADSLNFLPEGDDMKFYTDWALRIAHGQWTDHQAFYGLPSYAYCLALIFLIGGFNPFSVGLIQALFDGGVAVLLWQISREVFSRFDCGEKTDPPPRKADFIGIAAALAWTFFTPAQAFSVVMMPTVWLVFAYYLCLWFAVKTRAASWWKPWLFLGLFCGFIAMLVATILFAVPLLIVAIFCSVEIGQPFKARLPKIGAALATLIAGLYVGASPAWIHNYFIAHEPVMLSAHSGINFWIGNNPVATGYPKMPPGIRATQEGLLKDSITLAETAVGRKMTRAEVSKYWSTQANAYISEHFDAWMRLMGIKFANFWNAYQYDDLSIIKLLRDDGVLPPGLKFGFIAALGLAGLVPVLWRFPRATWVVAAVVLHLCALLPVFVTERYRLAAVPGLMILGSAGLWLFWQDLVSADWPRAGFYIALCGGAAWFVSIPRQDTGLWSLDFYKAGIRATTAAEIEQQKKNFTNAVDALDRAERNLETAYAYVPNNADIDFALGNLWLARSNQPSDNEQTKIDDRNLARKYYAKSLGLNRQHVGALNNWGVLEMDEKRWDRAEKFFAAAVKAEPEDAKAFFLLAHVEDELGKREEAKAAIDEALRLRPNQKQFQELRDKLNAPPPAPSPKTAPQ